MTDDFQKEQLIAARYGEKDRPENIIWNKQIEGLLCHRSVRSFSPQPLPEYWFETLVAAAQSASTSSNLQQWSVVAVTDPELKAQVRKLSAGIAVWLMATLKKRLRYFYGWLTCRVIMI
ncbi:nitroreductase family protein [Enterobacter pasteurii]|uniref:nitroreductase family protein n=1 Tax=Enterobacter pasteurii TaxID=3029761 RepID=UPI002109BE24|nr:nitroreductase family protein [Enterobacter pasteurii]